MASVTVLYLNHLLGWLLCNLQSCLSSVFMDEMRDDVRVPYGKKGRSKYFYAKEETELTNDQLIYGANRHIGLPFFMRNLLPVFAVRVSMFMSIMIFSPIHFFVCSMASVTVLYLNHLLGSGGSELTQTQTNAWSPLRWPLVVAPSSFSSEPWAA